MSRNDVIPITYKIVNGKRWIFIAESWQLQCAYCLHMQLSLPVREDDNNRLSLVTGIKVGEESHVRGCPQEVHLTKNNH